MAKKKPAKAGDMGNLVDQVRKLYEALRAKNWFAGLECVQGAIAEILLAAAGRSAKVSAALTSGEGAVDLKSLCDDLERQCDALEDGGRCEDDLELSKGLSGSLDISSLLALLPLLMQAIQLIRDALKKKESA